MRKIIFFLISVMTLLCSAEQVLAFEWKTYTSSKYIHGLIAGNEVVLASTEGGLLVVDPETGAYSKFTNTEGLGDNRLLSSAFAGEWYYFGSEAGYLTCFDYNNTEFRQYPFFDRDGDPLELNYLFADSMVLWISSNVGLSLFDIERHDGEIRETYRRFGAIVQGTGVNCAVVINDTIWVATSEGMAYAEKSDPNLLDYTHWTSITTEDQIDGLISDDFSFLIPQDQNLWAVADSLVYQIIRNSNGIEIGQTLSFNCEVSAVGKSQDSLYLGCVDGGLYSYYDGSTATLSGPSVSGAITAILVDPKMGLIVGIEDAGMFAQFGQAWNGYDISGPAENLVVDAVEDFAGRLVFAHKDGKLSVLDNNVWTTVNIPSSNILDLEVDDVGNIWVGTFGQGAFKVDSNFAVTQYDESNSTLIGNSDPGGLDYIVIQDMHLDTEGVFWFACYRGHVRRPVSLYSRVTDEWYFYSYQDFNQEAKIISIYSDGDKLWAGFEDDGIFVLEYDDDPFSPTMLPIEHLVYSNSLLPSENVRVITADRNDTLWIGTDVGVAFFDTGIDRFIRAILPVGIGPQVNDIVFDSRNNMWVATPSGLALSEASSNEFTSFTTATSDIVSDNINALLFDSERRLWICTENGISRLSYDIGAVTDDVSEVFAYPNPFVLTSSGGRVFFNYEGQVEVEIYSLDGRRIKTVMSNSGWDGTNSDGEMVASGMYLFYIRDEEGNSHTGKVAVVRKL